MTWEAAVAGGIFLLGIAFVAGQQVQNAIHQKWATKALHERMDLMQAELEDIHVALASRKIAVPRTKGA